MVKNMTIVILCLAVLAIALLIRSWAASPTAQRSLVAVQTAVASDPEAGDQQVLAQLRASGANLAKPTDIIHYLYIPSLENAKLIQHELDAHGYRAEVQEPLGTLPNGTVENRYSVVAHIDQVPSIENIRKARALFSALAKTYDGTYDGWEAAVVK
jgi:hypothetical protein